MLPLRPDWPHFRWGRNFPNRDVYENRQSVYDWRRGEMQKTNNVLPRSRFFDLSHILKG